LPPHKAEMKRYNEKGVGSGREQAIRALQGSGLTVLSIKDRTPTPHGGVRPKKSRRV
jgi:small subunit ribosomal protein S11